MSQRRNNRAQTKRSNATNTTPDEVASLAEMFPDWEQDDLASLLSEHNNLVEVVIDLIVNNKVAKWEPSRKEVKNNRKKDKEEDTNGQIPASDHKHRPKDPIPKKVPKKRTQNPEKLQPHKKEQVSVASQPTSSGPAVPANSWAAALAKDKPKPKPVAKETKEVKEEKEPREPKPHHKKAAAKAAPKNKAPEPENETVVEQAAPASSWASAIAPKTKPKPKKKVEAAAEMPAEESPVEDTTLVEQDSVSAQEQPNVVLPQKTEVDNVGVSFGSLALDDQVFEYQQQAQQQAQQSQPQQRQLQQQQPQQEQSQQRQPQQSQQPQQPHQSQQPQQAQQHQQPQQPVQQPVQQQQPQQKEEQAQFDYYSQFQQQFPQQTTQTIPGAQYVYPGMDYNYGQQAVASPAASHVSASSYPYQAAQPGQAPGQDGSVSTQSPLVNPSTLQQQQQQVPAAPYGYPYYNYYYNTPFYGNGAGLQQSGFGGINANATSSNAQGATGASTGAASGATGASGAAGAGFVNGFGNSQYYQPNQFANRYPYNYPQQPLSQPQQPQQQQQAGQPKENDQVASGQPQPQPPQPMPQYGGYQQYPQYGYQDNSQYRGWY